MLCLATQTVGGGVPADARELLLTKAHGSLAKSESDFLATVARSFLNNDETVDEGFSGRDLFFAKADLNGDGVEEFLITSRGEFICLHRDEGACIASIYTHSDSGWTYVGYTFSYAKGEFSAQALTIEDTVHNGWRVLNNGGVRRCWVISTGPERMFLDRDRLGFYKAPRQAGYFTKIEMNETCPIRQPPYP
jgi:hypothetical protein